MNQCPIYTAYDIMERVEEETVRLLDSFKQRLQNKGFRLGKYKYEEDQQKGRDTVWAWSYSFLLRIGTSMKQRSVALHFSMYRRPGPEISSWPHAREAILVVAYDQSFKERWDPDQLAIGADGFPRVWIEGDMISDPVEKRLLVWTEYHGKSWKEQSWLFAVPLLAVDTPEAVDREIVDPIKALLISNNPGDALVNTHAINWPEEKLSDNEIETAEA